MPLLSAKMIFKEAKKELTSTHLSTQIYDLLEEIQLKNPIVYNDQDGDNPFTVLHIAAVEGQLEIYQSVSDTLVNFNPKTTSGNYK